MDGTSSMTTGENSNLVDASTVVCLGDRIKAGQSWRGLDLLSSPLSQLEKHCSPERQRDLPESHSELMSSSLRSMLPFNRLVWNCFFRFVGISAAG